MSIVMPDLPGARVLDLFAGSGALGLEALSRGAAVADFVELAPKSLATLRANVDCARRGRRGGHPPRRRASIRRGAGAARVRRRLRRSAVRLGPRDAPRRALARRAVRHSARHRAPRGRSAAGRGRSPEVRRHGHHVLQVGDGTRDAERGARDAPHGMRLTESTRLVPSEQRIPARENGGLDAEEPVAKLLFQFA